MAIYVNENNKVTDIFVNVNGSKCKIASGWVHGINTPRKIFGITTSIAPIDDWLYAIDDRKNLVKLYRYIGSKTDVVVYSNYTIDNKTYKTALNTALNFNIKDYMFGGCTHIQSVKFCEGIDLSNTYHIKGMFYDCTSLTSIDISTLDVSGIVNMASMFFNCTSLVTLDLSNFNTRKVTNMYRMFYNCSSLKTIYVNRNIWSTSQASTNEMFTECGTSSVTYK